MARKATEDRQNVTARNSPVVAVRLTPVEARALEIMVEQAQARADELGIPATVTAAGLIRQWIRERAQAIPGGDLLPATQTPKAPPPTTQESIRARAREACERKLTSQTKLGDAVDRAQSWVSGFLAGKREATADEQAKLDAELRRLGA